MRLARLSTPDGPRHARWDADRWHEVPSFTDLRPTGRTFPPEATLLAPVEPRTVVGASHPEDDHGARRVQGWLKSSAGVTGPGGTIERAAWATTVVAEGELAVVIGAEAHALTNENALEHVLGFTIANDVTTVAPTEDAVFFAAKAGTGYTPLGPWIETDVDDPDALAIRVSVEGTLVRSSSTADLPHTICEILAAITRTMTLQPGDVVLTGSPSTDAALPAGTSVQVSIDRIGTLENGVV
ncbi:fumarylacetoacetate hydrolase family protein [Curtobacterium sp. PhB136]|uniref:fumarylacetoacetate hydrolase family protein n=1 Tax=Curtobacterium sp. PhB136 TaxID=2485181 RepID=UPI001044D85D|nr:fumarylacetoacetate hydrolase family protein [Curtobacterium sp. PhB136]TCK64547.1 2-keto-4-pentenoate hydratase/2-oxohepta-3-ene-1,7-dioic acid hydratase in catechol pathway [Curtobacterium sp. PhB136]